MSPDATTDDFAGKTTIGCSATVTLIGSTDLRDDVACPCCNQRFGPRHSKTLIEPALALAPRLPEGEPGRIGGVDSPAAAGDRDLDAGDENDEAADDDDNPDVVLPGVLAAGVRYQPHRILVEGWLHKKGTGRDWMSSRGWKARWTRLCLAHVDGYDSDVPLLLIYWFPASTDPSTVILLDDAVVVKEDRDDRSLWNAARFEVRHVPKDGRAVPVARTFAAPPRGRDAWVYAISDALLAHEKQKHQARQRQQQRRHLTELVQFRSENCRSPTIEDDAWPDEDRLGGSPPGSPVPFPRTPSPVRSPRLPRPEARRQTADITTSPGGKTHDV